MFNTEKNEKKKRFTKEQNRSNECEDQVGRENERSFVLFLQKRDGGGGE